MVGTQPAGYVPTMTCRSIYIFLLYDLRDSPGVLTALAAHSWACCVSTIACRSIYITRKWSKRLSWCPGCVGCAGCPQLCWLRAAGLAVRSCISGNAAAWTVTPTARCWPLGVLSSWMAHRDIDNTRISYMARVGYVRWGTAVIGRLAHVIRMVTDVPTQTGHGDTI